jgi:hypothetical protein
MDLTTILAIALACAAVIGFTIFAVKRSNLSQVNVSHGLDDRTGTVVQEVTGHVSNAAAKVSETAEHVANRVAGVVQPVGDGLGAVLKSIADRIGQKQAEFDRLNTQSNALALEVERLQNRKINVTDMAAQLKLALINISQQYTSLMRTTLETEEGSWASQETQTEYLGLCTANYHIHVGVDIVKLGFQLADDRIFVHGLQKVEIIGITDLRIDEPLAEIRKFTKEGSVRSARAEILINDGRTHEHAGKHHQTILEEIQRSQSIEHLAEPNAKFALAFLQACLSSSGLRVEESLKPLDAPKSFVELCSEVNRLVENRIEEMNVKLLDVNGQSTKVKSEMLAIAKGEA